MPPLLLGNNLLWCRIKPRCWNRESECRWGSWSLGGSWMEFLGGFTRGSVSRDRNNCRSELRYLSTGWMGVEWRCRQAVGRVMTDWEEQVDGLGTSSNRWSKKRKAAAKLESGCCPSKGSSHPEVFELLQFSRSPLDCLMEGGWVMIWEGGSWYCRQTCTPLCCYWC